ncbi:hypothetical protein [Streptomyces sp. TLI_171]|uniref:hypothetical protein n=1 Tax=Streptomyces sp. TLI_171 TaxID=1938859 RepID=UPI000C1A6B33|nr:hypothetical protein [Streptomyces sp. TLI_171]RKE17233.1 hypothetical protein BX266_0488 [Streptomyces sp. TLI_171]
MPVHSRLAVLGAGTVLGTALALGAAAPALACDEGPTATATPAPTSPTAPGSPSASASAPAAEATPSASVAILSPGERTVVAGGAPVEFTAEVRNTGATVLTGAAPLPAFRNDAARGSHETLGADDLLLQVATPAGWTSLPLTVDCDRSLRGVASPAADMAPGDSTRYTFRLTVTATTAQQVDVRLGLRSGAADSFEDAPHATFRIGHPATPAAEEPAAAEPAPTDGATAGSGSTPRTEVLGAAPAPGGSDATTPPATTTGPGPARSAAAQSLSAPAADGRPPTSLLVSGVVLVALGAAGFALALTHRPARHR